MNPLLPSLTVRVPATTANLGPGFDLFGLAIDRYATFQISLLEGDSCRLEDGDGHEIPIPPEKNLIRVGLQKALNRAGYAGKLPGIHARVWMDLPTGCGFGSSASALVAGVVVATEFLKQEDPAHNLNLDDELALLTELEGHPDNAVPARVGGFVFSVFPKNQSPVIIRKEIPKDLGLALLVPSFQVSTNESRASLPDRFSLQETLSNLQGGILWMEYLHTGDTEYLKRAIALDRIHEPHRKGNIPGYDQLKTGLLEEGCYGMTISGSGPGVLIYYDRNRSHHFESVIQEALQRVGQSVRQSYGLEICNPDYRGASVLETGAGSLHR